VVVQESCQDEREKGKVSCHRPLTISKVVDAASGVPRLFW